jgi:hypothetical protein
MPGEPTDQQSNAPEPTPHVPEWFGRSRDEDGRDAFTSRDEEDVAILGATFRPWPVRLVQYLRLRMKEERGGRGSRPPIT